jgi:hypothetical protein
MHASNGIRTHDPGVLADEDILCLKPCSQYDRQEIFDDTKLRGQVLELPNMFSSYYVCLNHAVTEFSP